MSDFSPTSIPGGAAAEDLVTSPCVSVCALDEQDICIGCQRTAA